MLFRILLFVSLLGGLAFGYNADVVSGAILFIRGQYHLNSSGTEIFFSVAMWTGFLAVLTTGTLSDYIGRRTTLICASAAVVLGSLIDSNFDIGRGILGWGLGTMTVATPLYLSEIVPKSHRGRIIVAFPCALTAGGLISHVVQLTLSQGAHWKIMMSLGCIPAFLQLIGLVFFIPPTTNPVHMPRATWRELLSIKVRMSVLAGVILAALEQATGANALEYYAPILLEQAGFQTPSSTLVVTLLLACTGLAMTILAVFLVDKVGRKPLLYRGLQMMALALMAIAFGFHLDAGYWQRFIVGFSLFLYAAAYNLSLGTLIWVLIPETFSSRYRAKGVSLALLINWICNTLVSQSMLSATHMIGDSMLFLSFSMLTVLAIFYVRRWVHEAI